MPKESHSLFSVYFSNGLRMLFSLCFDVGVFGLGDVDRLVFVCVKNAVSVARTFCPGEIINRLIFPNNWEPEVGDRRGWEMAAVVAAGSNGKPLLRNRYWVLRHGKSVPNAKGLIVSSLENGSLVEYSLAPEGVDQARLAGHSFRKVLQENGIPLEDVRICYSPFSRTSHTAKEVASVLDLTFDGPQCKVIGELRERFFGPSFELKSHDKYSEIWALDEKDPFVPPAGGESVADVVSRLSKALVYIESEFQGCAVLIVSHGDPLQILQTTIKAAKDNVGEPLNDDLESRLEAVKIPSVLSRHREYALLTGELRSIG